jgi:serine/threonine-protein kinase
VSPQSATIISWLDNAGGWGNGNVFQIDTSITVLCADASTPMRAFTGGPGVMDPKFCAPDCDYAHTMYPVPAGGAIEGESGYACMGGGDCHMLVVDVSHNWLWEMYGAFNPPDANNFYSVGGTILWDLTKAYSPMLRGDGCTSADAGGFPITAMLFSADEVAAGHIDHAIRFILPNARIQDGDVYVHPATHTGVASATTTRPNAPPYGVRMRLSPSFNLAQLNPGAQVVAKALQKYGMFLSDGGNIALTATNDSFTKAKWTDANVNLGAHDLSMITVTDFDVVDLGALVTTGDSCQLNGYRVP